MNIKLSELRSAIRSMFSAKAVSTRHNATLLPGEPLGRLGLAGAMLALAPLTAWSNQIYTVNIGFPPSTFPPSNINSVTGTITTDGATGSLSSSDFVGFDLDITYFNELTHTSGVMFALTGSAVTCASGGCGMSASATQLTFTPSLNESVTFQVGADLLALGSVVGTGWYANVSQSDGYTTPFYTATDPIIVGTPQSSVPEPGSLSLAALALAGLAATRRARQSRGAAARSSAAT